MMAVRQSGWWNAWTDRRVCLFIAECIAESPLIDICGIEKSSVAGNMTKFMDIASEMMRNLGMAEFESMSAAERCVSRPRMDILLLLLRIYKVDEYSTKVIRELM